MREFAQDDSEILRSRLRTSAVYAQKSDNPYPTLLKAEDTETLRLAREQLDERCRKSPMGGQVSSITSKMSGGIYSERATLYYNCARASANLGRHISSLERCEKALKLKPDYTSAREQRAKSNLCIYNWKHAVDGKRLGWSR